MANTVVIGMQWGDEGKGKIVDLLCPAFDVVARYQGGDNAGHTVKFGDQHFALHLIPSGILHEDLTCVLGNGMVMWTPTPAQVGDHQVTIRATDITSEQPDSIAVNVFAEQRYTLTVVDENNLSALEPSHYTFLSRPVITAYEGEQFQYKPSV